MKLIKNVIDELYKYLNVMEICIVVESGGIEGICDCEELEVGIVMLVVKVRIIYVKEVVGSGVIYDFVGELV